MKYLLALLFHPRSPGVDKIIQFKRRFDPKLSIYPGLHATLLPPFVLPAGEREHSFITELEEEVESFFDGHTHLSIPVEKLVIRPRSMKKYGLYLKLELTSELSYFQDHLIQGLSLWKDLSQGSKGSSKEVLISLGRFNGEEDLHQSIAQTGLEFHFPFYLTVEQIALLGRAPKEWGLCSSLARFETSLGLSPRG